MRRRASGYTLAVAGFGLFLVLGVLWGALAFAQTTMQTTASALYPGGVYSTTVVSLINFGMFAMPFLVIASTIAFIVVAFQRERRGEL